MKNLITNTIQWDRLGPGAASRYSLSVEKVSLHRETAVLDVELLLDFVIPHQDILRIRALLLNRFPELREVRFLFRYAQPMAMEKEDYLYHFVEHMIEEVNGSFASLTKTIFPGDCRVSDTGLELFSVGVSAERGLNRKVAPLFEEIIKKKFNIDVHVSFKNHSEHCAQTLQSVEEAMMEAVRQETAPLQEKAGTGGKNGRSGSSGAGAEAGSGGKPRRGRAASPGSGKKDLPADPAKGRILGKPVRGEVTALSALAVSEDVTVEGILFRKSDRTVRSDRVLVTLLLTDKKTSACVKAFMKKDQWEAASGLLEEGVRLAVRGGAQWDSFENETVLMARDIEIRPGQEVRDEAPVKRVELHAHTKMSAMDGLTAPKDLVAAAAAWGHRAVAITDHGVVQAFPDAAKAKKKAGENFKVLYGLEGYLYDDKGKQASDGTIDYKSGKTHHVIILARNQQGLKNLYKLVSISHLSYFYKKPRLPKSVVTAHREGLIIGSACEAGEVYTAVRKNRSEEELREIVSFYDYLEIQPLINNQFLIDNGEVESQEELREINRKIVALGEAAGKPVAATCDAHYLSADESIYRKILMAGQGYKDIEGDKGLYFRTTEEMLEEFAYLGEETAYRVVVENTNLIADLIEDVKPIASGKFPPKIENADEILRKKCMETARNIYGDPLPEAVAQRLERELSSIISNGYAVMYVSAEMLVSKSLEDGYLVGSRGSVGSSFAATMAGITEVNPLPPHYICKECRWFEWGDDSQFDCGVDMPEKACPRCGRRMRQEGFSIPFEVFLGFEGDKEPDIDLNFAGEYQPSAHKYVEEIFGKENVFRAGTIGAIKEKTAYGFVKKYYEERQLPLNKWEADRLSMCCEGVRRTTGQHPGGIIIVPRGHEIYEFCPVQYPANDTETDIITTHFDYHSIDENLLKLDILGHDVPSMIRHLQDMTGQDPLEVPLKEDRVAGIFLGTDTLDIKDPDYRFRHGTYGIPEFGTKFVRQMLDDTSPRKFGDLVRISGFSHGTDVWLNNAQEFIRSGQATMDNAISTRDDIMNYLIHKGVPNLNAFKIMENVRKGKGLSGSDEELMKENGVPDWYITSCNRIKYMFPRAHAVAYVMMSYRIAYYKVYHPLAFYAACFTVKVNDFEAETILKGAAAVLERMDAIEAKGKNATQKEQDALTVLELAYEMYARGYRFCEARLGSSDPVKFQVRDGKVVLPLLALSGVGETAARLIAEEHEKSPFLSVEEIRKRAKANKTAIEALKLHGVLEGLAETDQLSLF